jgi:hypothetical protein
MIGAHEQFYTCTISHHDFRSSARETGKIDAGSCRRRQILAELWAGRRHDADPNVAATSRAAQHRHDVSANGMAGMTSHQVQEFDE